MLTALTVSFKAKVLIFLTICSVSYISVLGSKITNSSPPSLAIISLDLHPFFITSDTFSNNSSPVACPKESFTSFSPLTSAITIVKGKFFSTSSLFNSFSKNLLLYNPVN